MVKADILRRPVSSEEEIKKLIYFTNYFVPADKKLAVKLRKMLKLIHKKGMTRHAWFYKIIECLKNHYRVLGNSLFFNDSEKIFNGVKEFNYDKALESLQFKLDNLVQVPTGMKGLQAQI
jgi:hypothetical protein